MKKSDEEKPYSIRTSGSDNSPKLSDTKYVERIKWGGSNFKITYGVLMFRSQIKAASPNSQNNALPESPLLLSPPCSPS